MKQIFFGLMLTMCTIGIYAQNATLNGKVTDENGTPLEGVTVKIKGANNGIQSSNTGTYKISIPSTGAVVVFSYVGYNNVERKVTNATTLNVKMEKSNATLDELVVIGYQSVKRKDVLASVSSISAKDLRDIPANSAAEVLNGRLAGVTATTAEGSPDANIRIRVRGGMSITGDNSPLYILDGVQVENALNLLSPQDIQSIDVLKDAAATAIYGARGANGVVVITTKSGKKGKMKVSYNAFVGVKDLAKKLGVLNPYDYTVYQYERTRGNATDSASFAKSFGTNFDTLSVYKKVNPIDWQEQVFGNTGELSSHNVNVTGGTNKLTYDFGGTNYKDIAVVRNSSLNRNMAYAKLQFSPIKKLKMGATARYMVQDVFGAGVSDDKGSSFNRLRNAVRYRPFLSANQEIDDADPLADPSVGNGLNLVNPIQLTDQEYRKRTTYSKNASFNLSYTILKNVTFASTVGFDDNAIVDRKFSDSATPYSVLQGSRKPIMSIDSINRTTITNSNVLTYAVNNLNGKHDFSFLVGEETYDMETKTVNNLFRLLPNGIAPNDAFFYRVKGTAVAGYPKLNQTKYTNLSLFSRMSYAYMDKYLFSANVRADGASKFSESNRWGYFPSGSFAWRVKKEKFLENVDAISDMKLRLGYGEVGNNRINDYLYLNTYNNSGSFYYGVGGQTIYGYSSASLVNPNLLWESTVSRNIGLDLTLFKRLNITVDVYNNASNNLLLNVPIASTYGYSTQLQNIGRTSNKGVEIALSGLVMSKGDFNWNANFNISFNKNTIEELGVRQSSFFPAASWGVSGQPTDYIAKIGQPVGAMYGLVTDGYYTTNDFDYNYATGVYTLKSGVTSNAGIIGTVMPGAVKFKDLNNDGKIDLNNDRTIIGNPTPKFTGGLSQQFTYKNWDMSMFVNFSYGNKIYNANKIELTNGYTPNGNLLDMMANRYRTVDVNGKVLVSVNSTGQVVGGLPVFLDIANTNANIWSPLKSAGAFYPHSWAMEDGSFIRINNMTIGHTITSSKLAKLKISKLRFYLTGNNLAVFTKYTGYDPEVSVSNNGLTPGLDYSAYPKSRSFIFGLNVTF
jgi:TonB-linked SusC/RagA family outer membrane protein